MDKTAKKHIQAIKELPCGLCGAPPPSDAHHLIENRGGSRKTPDMTVIPLCHDSCHQGPNGIHGDRALFRIYKKSELQILDETIRKLFYDRF